MSNLSGLIIASGYSKRMGKPKPLLVFNDVSFLSGIILKLGLICNKIIIVLGHQKELIEKETKEFFNSTQKGLSVNNCFRRTKDITSFLYNSSFPIGMFTSIQYGLSHLLNSTWVIYHFVDQPNLPVSFYFDIKDQIESGFDWIQPVYNKNPGHPILINNNLFSPILNASKTSTLRSIVKSQKVNKKYWNTKYQEVIFDCNTKEDYEKLASADNESLLENLTLYI
ncbi:NTP transferase domain-containing protein [Bacteroidota bacterium]